MKFGRKLVESAHPSFRNYYIAYQDLKEAIKVITGQAPPPRDELASPMLVLLSKRGVAGRTPESQFQELLDNELNKINNFANVQFSVLMEKIREVLYRLTHANKSDKVEELLETIRAEITAFDEYIRLNFSGFRKALKKFDKWNESDSSNWFLQRVVQSDFMCIDMDKLILGLAIAERRFKNNDAPLLNLANSTALEIHAKNFRRSKFFVSPDEFVSLEIELMKHMDIVLAFPLSRTVPPQVNALVDEYLSLGVRKVGEVSIMEHVVVFDKEFKQYSIRRSKTMDPAVAGGYVEPVFSIRWNSLQSKEGRCVLVKECHSRWNGSGGMFELELKQQTIMGLVKGTLTLEQALKIEEGRGKAMLEEFCSKFLNFYRPSVMYSYRRILLESANLFVGLDRDIKFIDLVDHEEVDFFVISHTYNFQAILTQRTMTVWTRQAVETDWMKTIVGRPSVSEVVGFSKAIHAEAILHVVTAVDRPVSVGLPHWFLHTISGGSDMKSKFENLMSMAGEEDPMSRGATPNLAMMASPRITGKFDVIGTNGQIIHDIVSQQVPPKRDVAIESSPLGPSPMGDLNVPLLDRAPPRRKKTLPSRSIWDELKFILFGSVAPELSVPSKIEPKTFLANERTFLNWCFVSFLISALAIALVSLDPSANLEAASLSLVAIVTIAWSLNVYRLRVIALRNIKSIDSLIVSSNGATAVALSVTGALLVTWYSRYRQYTE